MMLLVKSSCKDGNHFYISCLLANYERAHYEQTKSNLIDNEVTAIRSALDPHEVLRLMVVVQVGQQPAGK